MVKNSQARRAYDVEMRRQEALVTDVMHDVAEMRNEGDLTEEQVAHIRETVGFYLHVMERLLRDIYRMDQ